MLTYLLLLAVSIVLIVALTKSTEAFSYNYDAACIKTCQTQSTNASDQCLNDCQMPCNNKCWEDCYRKSLHFDDYLRCGVRCPDHYFSS